MADIKTLTVVIVNEQYAHEMTAIDFICYGKDECMSLEKWNRVLANPSLLSMVILHENKTIAEAVVQATTKVNKVLRFGVHPEWRRKGIGRMWMEMLKNCGLLKMDLKETNTVGLAFAKSLGFVATELEKADHCDWIKMQIPE